MELARLTDEDGDTHSILITDRDRRVIRIGHSDNDSSESDRIHVEDALKLIDAAGLNTTANDLRTENQSLDDQLIQSAIDITDLRSELAAANETIAQLRQRDTVRPEVDIGQVWNDGYDACKYNRDIGRVVEKNPYR